MTKDDSQKLPRKSKLEALAQKIYSRTNPPRLRGRRILRKGEIVDVNEDIDPTVLGIREEKVDENVIPDNQAPLTRFYDDILNEDEKSKFWTAPKIFLLVSVFFFMFSAFGAYYLIINGFNEVSTKNIKMMVKGPNYIESGELLQLQVFIENRNNARLDLADLIVDYPLGTVVPEEDYTVVTLGTGDSKRKVVRQRLKLKSIEAGELKKGTVRARLFGEKDIIYPINVTLEYRLKGSNAVFAVEREYKVKMASDALLVDVKGPKEAIFGQNPTLNVTLRNNSKSTINFVALEARLPLGVEITNADPEPKEKNKWFFPMLEAGESRDIKIHLKVDGQSGDERVVKFVAGVDDPFTDRTETDLVLKQVDHKISISRPFLATFINIGVEHDNGYAVMRSGRQEAGNVSYVNTLATPIEDVVLALTLKGNALNKYGVDAPKGFYKSSSNVLVWDKTTVGKKFEFMQPAASGQLNFKIASKTKQELASVNNPTINLTVNAAAKRLSEDGVIESLDAVTKKEIRIETDIDFSARSLYFENPLQSAGALPPKVDSPTIYGVEWTITNTSNEAQDVEVSAFLPPNVEWGGVTMPATESLSYNPTNGQIVWRLGKVKAGSGYYLPARRVYFNVILTPSVTQLGKEAPLLVKQEIKAHDVFTDTDIQYKIQNLDTRLLEANSSETYFKVVK